MSIRSLLAVLIAFGAAGALSTAMADDAAPTPLPAKAAESSPPPAADKADMERETLARLAGEIVLLEAEVEDAARNAPTATRVQFRYDWLASDLELIERGIRDHLDAPRQPRVIEPLKGDYRR